MNASSLMSAVLLASQFILTPVRADECDNLLATMKADIAAYNSAFDALPIPKPYTDAATCSASAKYEADWNVFNEFEGDKGQCASDSFEDTLTEDEGNSMAAHRDFHC